MRHHDEVINSLEKLDLKTYPKDSIIESIQEFGSFGLIKMRLNRGMNLIRVRPNEPDKTFSTRDELSFKPQKFNTTYQRASTPNQTMFYGTTYPDTNFTQESYNPRFISSIEGSSLLRDLSQVGEQKITYSRWVVTNEIDLVAICYHKDFINNNPYSRELHDTFKAHLSQHDSAFNEKTIKITEFLAKEFSKEQIGGDYDYMISALFSEIVVKKGLAGVYYPSVRAEGIGYNVAIEPMTSLSSLALVAVAECTIYKKGKNIIVDNETACLVSNDKIPFELKPVDAKYHMGKELVYARLNSQA